MENSLNFFRGFECLSFEEFSPIVRDFCLYLFCSVSSLVPLPGEAWLSGEEEGRLTETKTWNQT